MSAIAGYWNIDGSTEPARITNQMLRVLDKHGPDALGVRASSAFGVGYRSLKITNEDAFEVQPLVAEGGRFWLVADARIDNREQLAHKLGISPAQSASLPDSNFILRAWEKWLAECVHELVGAFAFAVWDEDKKEFFLARDHAGERTLFFRKTVGSFAFATTARAILSCPGVSDELDEEQLARDLVSLPPDQFRTRFREVDSVAAGHFVIARGNELIQRRYWQFDSLPEIRFHRDHDYVEAFLEVFDEAVRCRLRSAGKIASELSGGLDSGSVTATAARILGISGKTLYAFTSVPRAGSLGKHGFPARVVENEGPYAAELASMYPNVEHFLVESSKSNMVQELERYFRFLDIPVVNPLNGVWANLILDEVVGLGANVLLTGALGNFTMSYAGDEILYPLFRKGHWVEMLLQAARLRKAGLSSGRHAASLTLFGLLPWSLRRLVDPLLRSTKIETAAIRPERAKEWDLPDKFQRYIFERSTHLPKRQETDFHRHQYGEYNAAANAGWGVEVRDPTADKRVFEFCASIPPEQYVVGGRGRSLIRRAMNGRLPEATLRRSARGLQSSDWYASLTEIESLLKNEISAIRQSPIARRLIDVERLQGALDAWPKTVESLAGFDTATYQHALTRGIACGYFIRRVEEGI